MSCEGLKVPIELIPDPTGSHFYVRAGFRRTRAARNLRWQHIPAIILPANTPVVDEYWTNVIENSARDRLTSYEIAHAAATMRDKFGIRPGAFAKRAGYSETYVQQLLRCLDRLPPEIVDLWKSRAPIPVAQYDKWTQLTPDEAVKAMNTYRGRNPRVVGDWLPPANLQRKPHPIKMASSAGLKRMQRLRFAVEVARELDEKSRRMCLALVDYCTGAREDVPGVWSSGSKLRTYKSRRKEDLNPTPLDLDALAISENPESNSD